MKRNVIKNISIDFLVKVIQKLGGKKGATYFLSTGKLIKNKKLK